jgi:flagellar assembly protein FliH
MSIFRAGQTPTAVQRPIWQPLTPTALVREVEPPQAARPQPDAARAADDVLNQARMQAAEMLQQAASEAEAAVTESRQQGYEAGLQQGLAAAVAELEAQRQQARAEVEQARAQAEAIRQAAEAEARATRAEAEVFMHTQRDQAREEAEALLAEARQEQHRYLDEAKEALVDLAVAAAMRLVHGHLAVQPAAVTAMVAAGLRRLKDSNCTVRVSPQDLPLLHAQRSTLERELGAGVLKLQADPTLQPGSYVVASPLGQIDATLDSQAAHLRTALTAAMGGD